MAMYRRDILIGAGATSLALLWGCNASTALSPEAPLPSELPAVDANKLYDVIVVGAGAAGIAAARAVQSAKQSVVILEAMDRLGGRCYSYKKFPIPFDVGAQFVGQATSLNNFLYPLMRQLRIPLIAGEDVPRFLFDPKTGKKAEIDPFLDTYVAVDAALLDAGEAMELGAPDASAEAVVADAGLRHAPYLKLASEFLISAIDGGSLPTQSTLDLYNNTKYIPAAFFYPPKDTFLIPSGYGAFIERLAKGLPIRLNSPVKRIDYSKDRVSVRTLNDETFYAKAVIVTTSVNVLKSGGLTFMPELPPSHQKALSGLTMGHAWKGMLEFHGRPFDVPQLPVHRGKMFTTVALVNDASAQYFGNYFAQQFPDAGATYLMTIAEEELALSLEKMGPQRAGKRLCDMLEVPFPGITAAWTGRIQTSNWATNPYTLGCISYATPGNAHARVTLSRPVKKKVWFAGEAISVHSHSLVNGAWATGTDAAYGALFAIGALTKKAPV